MNNLFALLAVAVMLFVSGCIGTQIFPSAPQNDTIAPAPSAIYIGDNSDTHGCKGPEGYFWCPIKDKCIKIPEEKCQYEAPPSGVTSVSAEACAGSKGTVVDGVDVSSCPYGSGSAIKIMGDGTPAKVCCLPAAPAAE